MRVELLYAEDDPNVMEMRQRLVEVLAEDAFETAIQMIAVRSLDDAELLDFPGSPTIRIDGVDVDPDSATGIALGPRSYPDEGSGSGPLPDRQLLRRALERARGWGHARRPIG